MSQTSAGRRCGAALLLAALAASPMPATAQGGTFGADQRSCDRSALDGILSTSKENLIGSGLGAVAGGLLGNQLGKGSGNTVMTIVGALGGALAGGYVGRSMAPADQACVDRSLEHAPTGQSVAWRDPDKDASYWVTPTSTFQGQQGEPCRHFVTDAVIEGRRERVEGTACRQNDGTWRTLDEGAPRR